MGRDTRNPWSYREWDGPRSRRFIWDLYDFIFTDHMRGQYSYNNKTSFPQPPHPRTTSVCWARQPLLRSQSTPGRYLYYNPNTSSCAAFPSVVLTPSASDSPPPLSSPPPPHMLIKNTDSLAALKTTSKDELGNLHSFLAFRLIILYPSF